MKKLGFGLMRLPIKGLINPLLIDHKALSKMVDTFLERGFTYFDTAYMYHGGRSEVAIRKALVKRYPRDSFTLTDKLPTMMLKTKADMERIFEKQRKRCGVDFFDYYLLHSLTAENYAISQKLDAFGFVLKLKQEGKVKHIGISYHDNAELLEEILTAHPEIEYVQLQINYLDWENESIQSKKCYEIATKHNKPVIVMEPVKGGSLAKVPEDAERLFKSKELNMSVASWAIRYAASLQNVMVVLSGMSDVEQLNDNTAFMENFKPFDEEEYATVNGVLDIIKKSIAIPCTGCHYCTDGCPKKIAIPEYFALYNAEKLSKKGLFSIQRNYYENYIKKFGKASDCIACGQCERHCPQHLKIIDGLKFVRKEFGK